MPEMHVNFMQVMQKCMNFLFRKEINAIVDSYIDWSQDVCHKLNFMWPGALGLE